MQLTKCLDTDIRPDKCILARERIKNGLLRRMDTLRHAIKESSCKHMIHGIIVFLEEYIKVHLSEEERAMRHYGYPSYFPHKEKHERFAAGTLALKEELLELRAPGARGAYELSVKTVHMVVDWVNDHVTKDDKEFCWFLGHRFF